MTPLAERLAALIRAGGPISVADMMRAALFDPQFGYYTTRAPLGADGDFITAPEISQMFGELIGLWAAQSWRDMGAPRTVTLLELGPGRGALMADALRAARRVDGFLEAARVCLLEVNPALRAAQAAALTGCAPTWLSRIEDAPDGPTLLIANEFFDCLPVRQFHRRPDGWREVMVGLNDSGRLAFGLTPGAITPDAISPALRDAPTGAFAETMPELPRWIDAVATRLHTAPGRALIVDYGPAASSPGATLQAVRAHGPVDPLENLGEADLTAHLDFGEVTRLARAAGLTVAGPCGQGAFLEGLGVRERAAALSRARPDQAGSIAAALARLTAPDQMGILFQATALSSPGLPPAPGFAP